MRSPSLVLTLALSCALLPACDGDQADAPVLGLLTSEQTEGKLVVSNRDLYFIGRGAGEERGTLRRVPTTGGDAEAILDLTNTIHTPDFVVGNGELFWIDDDDSNHPIVRRLHLSDLQPESQVVGPMALDLDGRLAATGTSEAVYACSDVLLGGPALCTTSGRAFAAYAPSMVPTLLVADTQGAYWNGAADDIIFSSYGGNTRTLVSGQSGMNLMALDQTYVYWASSDLGYVRRVAKDGFDAVTLAANQGYIGALVADRGEVFWTTATSEGTVLMHLAPGAEEPETLRVGVSIAALAVDAENVYFQDESGIRSLPR